MVKAVASGQVEGIGQAVKHVAALRRCATSFQWRGHRAHAAQNDNRQFVGAGFRGVLGARRQLASFEGQIFVTEPSQRDP